MAPLYGRLRGSRREVTRAGHRVIESSLETWDGEIRTVLEKDGTFSVFIGPKYGPVQRIVGGNVNDDIRFYQPVNQARATFL